MAPILPKQSTNIGTLTSDSLIKNNKKKVTNKSNVVNKVATTGQLTTPVVSSPIQTPQQLMTPMSQELPIQQKTTAPIQSGQQAMPEWMPLIAGNVSQESLQPQKESKYMTKDKVREILMNAPEWVDKSTLLDDIVANGYILEWYNDPQSQITQAPVRVDPQFQMGETPQAQPTLLETLKSIGNTAKESYNTRSQKIQEWQAKYSWDTAKDVWLDLMNSLWQAMWVFQDVWWAVIGGTAQLAYSKLPEAVRKDFRERTEYDLARPEVQYGLAQVSKWMDSYNEWKESNPDTAVATDFFINGVTTALDLAWLKAIQAPLKAWVTKAWDTISDIAKTWKWLIDNPKWVVNWVPTDFRTTTKDAVMSKVTGKQQGVFRNAQQVADDVVKAEAKATAQAAKQASKATWKQWVVSKWVDAAIEQVEWISKAQKQWLQNNPYTKKYMSEVLEKIDSGNAPQDLKEMKEPYVRELTSKLDDLFDKERSIKSETGKAYQILRSDPKIYDTDNMVWEMSSLLKWTDYNLRSFLNRVDKGNLLWTRSILDWSANTSQLHDIRKWIDDLMRKAEANKDSWEFNILTKMRKIVDNKLKENPNWAKSDEMFSEEMKVLSELEEWVTYREKRKMWQIKDNIDNILENINNPAKAQLKERLIKYMPDLPERIAAIRAIPEIAQAYTAVPKGTASRIAWASVWAIVWSTAWPVGTAVWIVTWFFTDVAMSKVRQSAIAKAIQKQSPQAIKRLEEIQDAIKAWEDISNKKIQELESHLKKIIDDMNDPVMKAEMGKMNAEILSKKIKNRSIVPLKEWVMKKNPATAVIKPKWPVTTITEKWVAKKPWTTKVDQAIKKIESGIKKKKAETPVKTVAKKTETVTKKSEATIQPKVQKELQSIAKWVKEKNTIEDRIKTAFKQTIFSDMKVWDKMLQDTIALYKDASDGNIEAIKKIAWDQSLARDIFEKIYWEKLPISVDKSIELIKSKLWSNRWIADKITAKINAKINQISWVKDYHDKVADSFYLWQVWHKSIHKWDPKRFEASHNKFTEKSKKLVGLMNKVKEVNDMQSGIDKLQRKLGAVNSVLNKWSNIWWIDAKWLLKMKNDLTKSIQKIENTMKSELDKLSKTPVTQKVNQELQTIAKWVKEKSLAKKENGSIMDSMETTKLLKGDELQSLKNYWWAWYKKINEDLRSWLKNEDANNIISYINSSKFKEKWTFYRSTNINKSIIDDIKKSGVFDSKQIMSVAESKFPDEYFMKWNWDKVFMIVDWQFSPMPIWAKRFSMESEWLWAPAKYKAEYLWEYLGEDWYYHKIKLTELSPKSDTKIIPKSKVVSKDLQPLYEEARKYKSADEFVENSVENTDETKWKFLTDDFIWAENKEFSSSMRTEWAKETSKKFKNNEPVEITINQYWEINHWDWHHRAYNGFILWEKIPVKIVKSRLKWEELKKYILLRNAWYKKIRNSTYPWSFSDALESKFKEYSTQLRKIREEANK